MKTKFIKKKLHISKSFRAALVFYDPRCNVSQNALSIAFSLWQVPGHAQYLTAFTNEKFKIIVRTFVCDLCETCTLRREMLVQIEELKTWWIGLIKSGRKYGWF